jgi:5-methylcytosine-specific restriction endonuclease McrA
MNLVKSEDRTTLLLSASYEPFAFLTARAAIKYFMTNKVSGVDVDGNTFAFGETQVRLPLDNPALATVSRNILIPTIVKLNKYFGFRRRVKSQYVSLKSLYKLYKGKCQYCLQDIPYKEATKDHYYPKSKGGTDHDFNLVLACKRCNHIKDSTFPYYNKKGELVEPKKFSHLDFILDHSVKTRKEWEPYLYRV